MEGGFLHQSIIRKYWLGKKTLALTLGGFLLVSHPSIPSKMGILGPGKRPRAGSQPAAGPDPPRKEGCQEGRRLKEDPCPSPLPPPTPSPSMNLPGDAGLDLTPDRQVE